MDAAKIRFDALVDYASLEEMIEEGVTEDIFYECKAPNGPKVTPDTIVSLARAVSGYSNTEGGMMMYGIETSKLEHSSSDVMISIPRVGAIKGFRDRLINTIPTLTLPAVTRCEAKIIKKNTKDTAGVLIIYIPKSETPIQSLKDSRFYFRAGDQFQDAPYSVIQRLFTATSNPDLNLQLANYKNTTEGADHKHQISLILRNDSLAVGKEVYLMLELTDVEGVKTYDMGGMMDDSGFNNERKMYSKSIGSTVHHDLGLVVVNLGFVMQPRKKKVEFKIRIFAEHMMPKRYLVKLKFNQRSLASQDVELIT